MSEMDAMNEFEKRLASALRRVDAPEGFAARVVARAETSVALPRNVVEMRPRSQRWMAGAVAAMLAVGAFVGEAVHVRHEREQAALATQQFEAAVRVTDHAIEQTRMQLEKAGLKLGD